MGEKLNFLTHFHNESIKQLRIAGSRYAWFNLAAILLVISFSFLIAFLIPDYAVDFSVFYQAGSAIASGHSPYSVQGYYSPVWVALFFVPFSFFSQAIAYRIYAAILFSGYIYIFWKLSNRRIWITLIACFSPFLFMTMQYGNIDWFVLLGLLTPTPIGLWFLLSKPQVGFILVLLLAWKTYKQQGMKKLCIYFFPPAIGLAISYWLGMYIPNPANMAGWSADVWPFGLLIGLPALIFAFKNQDEKLALAAAPFLVPYIGPMSWVAIFPVAMKNYKRESIAWIISWIIVINWRLHL